MNFGRNAHIFNTIQDEGDKRAPVSVQKVKVNRTPTIEPDQYFHVVSGQSLKSLYDLQDASAEMPQSVWDHHVAGDRNDFANWIEHVFKNKKLADRVRTLHAPKALHDLLAGPAI